MFSHLKPDYQDNSLVNLISSIQAACGGKSEYPPTSLLKEVDLASAKHVVLVVLDGLGYRYLMDNHPSSFIARHCKGRMTSVFPTTTSSAISTIMSGMSPLEHAFTGWFIYFRELGSVAASLPFAPRMGGASFADRGIRLEQVTGFSGFYRNLKRRVYLLNHDWLINTPYSRHMSKGATTLGYKDLADGCRQVEDLLSRKSDSFIYAYWSELDHHSHKFGISSAEASERFLHADQQLEQLAQKIAQTDSVMLITADHGLIDTAQDKVVHLEDHPQLRDMLALPLCGEPRAAYCYLRPGVEREFEIYVNAHLQDQCTAYRSEELVRQGLFGAGNEHKELRHRIGDYVLLMKDNFVIKDRLLGEKLFDQVGVHGGLSEKELYVPLSVVRAEP